MAEASDRVPTIEDTYEHPTADRAILSALRAALASVPDLHEAYLVSRQRRIDGRTKSDGLGVVARAGGRWRAREQVAALADALKPFHLPGDTAPLKWSDLGNTPVAEEQKPSAFGSGVIRERWRSRGGRAVKRRTAPSDRGLVQIVLRPILALCCAAFLGSGVSVGAATAQSGRKVTLRIFDPKGRVHAQVTLAGIVRSKTRVIKLPGDQPGAANLSLGFTKAGWTSFCSLTRGLAHVGTRLHRLQSDALKVDGRLYSRGYIEYRIFPNGLCVKGSAPRILFSMKLATARSLTRLIRS